MLGSISKAGLEEFAGQELSIQTGFTIATGLFGNHQDPFGTAFFPPIEIEPICIWNVHSVDTLRIIIQELKLEKRSDNYDREY